MNDTALIDQINPENLTIFLNHIMSIDNIKTNRMDVALCVWGAIADVLYTKTILCVSF